MVILVELEQLVIDTEADTGAMEGRGFSGRGQSETRSDFENRVRNQKEIFQAAERRQALRSRY